METELNCEATLEIWFNRGKEDAWASRSKQPPEQDPEAASFYDLGYSEGAIEHPCTTPQSQSDLFHDLEKLR